MTQSNNKRSIRHLWIRQSTIFLVILIGMCLVVFKFYASSQVQARSWYEDKATYPSGMRYEDDIYEYFTNYYLQVHERVQAGTATPQESWDYNILLRQENARDFLKITLTKEQAKARADDLLATTYQDKLPSAILQTAYVNIEKGIGQPLYEIDTEAVYESYYPVYFKNATVQSPEHLAKGLTDMIEWLKTQSKNECFADYNPLVRYPYFNNTPKTHPEMYIMELNKAMPEWTDTPRMIEHIELRVGSLLDEFPRSAVTGYPDIEKQLDLISLRNKVHCKSDYHNLSTLGGYLVGQTIDDIRTHDYATLVMPTDMDNYHEQLFLSVYAQLMDKPEFASVFASRVADEDKAKFAQDRAQLLSEYHEVFGD